MVAPSSLCGPGRGLSGIRQVHPAGRGPASTRQGARAGLSSAWGRVRAVGSRGFSDARLSPQMNDNLLDCWSDLDELKGARSLETVYLERNPLQRDPQYRRKIMLALPSVRQIDATFVRF